MCADEGHSPEDVAEDNALIQILGEGTLELAHIHFARAAGATDGTDMRY